MTPALIPLADVMTQLGIRRKAVMRLIAIGKLRGLHVGRQWRFDPRDVEAYIAAEKDAARPKAPLAPLPTTVRRGSGELSWKGANYYQ